LQNYWQHASSVWRACSEMPAVAIAAARIVRRAADIIRLRRPHAAMAPHDQYTGGSLG